jgi:protein-S-isoprenylcysteine O-methyltransferase Ste14
VNNPFIEGEASMSSERSANLSVVGYVLKGLIAKFVFVAPWLWAAGQWFWFWPWLYMGMFVVFDVVVALICDPGMLAERAKPAAGAKPWDRTYVMLAAVLLPVLAGVVAGLDLRFGWAPEVSVTAQWIATVLVALGFAIVGWSMCANSYFSAIVRIQAERGHRVADGGPYQFVRHPGYIGAILFTVAMPVMFGSLWGLIPAIAAAIVYVLRTKREDDTLQAELEGYREFTQKTRYRLLPGIW